MIQNPNVLVNNFINKEGVVIDGEVSTITNLTYTGNFQYLDVDYIPTAQGGGLTIRDIGDDYGTIYPKLVTIIDRESGRVYNTGSVLCDLTDKPLKLRIDSHSAKGVRIVVSAGINGKLTVTKVNANTGKIDLGDVKFQNLTNSSATSVSGSKSITFFKDVPHKKYLVLRVSIASTSVYSLRLVNVENASSSTPNTNNIYLQGKNALLREVKYNFAGTKCFYADVSSHNICTLLLTSNAAANVQNIDYLLTDDLELAEYLVGRNKDSKNTDVITNDGMVQNTYIDLSKITKRWYVVYLDVISGYTKYNANSTYGFYIKTPVKMYRYDMAFSSNINCYFRNIGGLKSGYYFLDISTASDSNALVNLTAVDYDSSNVENLNMQIVHIGEYDDISQFQKFDEQMAFGDGLFECKKISDIGVSYALDDYWASVSANVVTLCQNDNIYKLNVQDAFNWRMNGSWERSIFIIHPSIIGNVDSLHTNLIIQVYDDNDGGKSVYKVCNIDNPNDIYTLSNWSNVKFWEKKGSARKIPTKDSNAVDAFHRFDTTLPDSFYDYDEVSSDNYHIAWQDAPNVFSIQHFMCHGKTLTLWGTYDTAGRRIAAWATSDGGRNFVAFYDFVNYYDNDFVINTSGFADYSSGLTLNKVTCINPTAENKEPENKYSITELTGWTITKGTTTKITFSSAHGITENTIVAFTGNSTSEWNQLKTSSLTVNSIGDNVYLAVPTSTTELTLKAYIGSYDTQLSCRHIHSINECKTGYIIGCGEEYPNGWILFVEDWNPSTGQNHDAMTRTFNVTRLTSTPDSLQRACGFILKEDGTDPTIIFASDSANIGNIPTPGDNFRWSIPGRTNLPKSNSLGIWKGKLSDIDDITKFECICDIPHDLCIWMFRYNNIIVVYCQYGGMAVSIDDGESFTYYPYYFAYRRLTGVYHGKIILNGGYAMTLIK